MKIKLCKIKKTIVKNQLRKTKKAKFFKRKLI